MRLPVASPLAASRGAVISWLTVRSAIPPLVASPSSAPVVAASSRSVSWRSGFFGVFFMPPDRAIDVPRAYPIRLRGLGRGVARRAAAASTDCLAVAHAAQEPRRRVGEALDAG